MNLYERTCEAAATRIEPGAELENGSRHDGRESKGISGWEWAAKGDMGMRIRELKVTYQL